LTPEQREDWVTSCQDIIVVAGTDKNFFNKIIRRDETWYFAYDPETKWQFWMGWWEIPSTEETKIPKVTHQDHVDNFFDSQGIVNKEFLPEGKTVNAEFYKKGNESPPEAHSTGLSSCIVFSRFFLVTW